MQLTKCAVVGVGYLGRFHAQKYAQLPASELIGVCDTNREVAQTIAKEHGVQVFDNYQDLIGKVDAVSIVVPTQKHYEVARTFLENGDYTGSIRTSIACAGAPADTSDLELNGIYRTSGDKLLLTPDLPGAGPQPAKIVVADRPR